MTTLHINPPVQLSDPEARMAIDAATADAHRKAEDAVLKGNHGAAAYWNGYADGMKRAEAQIPTFERELQRHQAIEAQAMGVPDDEQVIDLYADTPDTFPLGCR